jgi:hypothetical protein
MSTSGLDRLLASAAAELRDVSGAHADTTARRAQLDTSLRRRRTARLVAVAVLVAAAVVTVTLVHSSKRLEPAQPTVPPSVAFTPLPSDSQPLMLHNLYSWAQEEGVAADYLARLQSPDGGTVEVIGIQGPGLAAASDAAQPATSTASKVTLRATYDCASPGWSTATDADYRVRVDSIDQNGRHVQATVPLPVADARAWHEVIQRACLTDVLAAATTSEWHAGVVTSGNRAAGSAGQVVVSARVRNPADFPIYLQFFFPHAPAGNVPPAVQIPAHGSAVLTTRWSSSQCTDYPADLLGLLGSNDPSDYLLVRAGVRELGPALPDPVDPNQTAIKIPHALRLHLQSIVDQACRKASR